MSARCPQERGHPEKAGGSHRVPGKAFDERRYDNGLDARVLWRSKGPKDVALGQKVPFSVWLGLFNLSSSHLCDLGWPRRAGLSRARSKGTSWGRHLVARLK